MLIPLQVAVAKGQVEGSRPETPENPPPPPKNGNNDRSDPRPIEDEGSGKIYDTLETDYGPDNFILESPAVDKGRLLDKYKCENKVEDIEKSIPLSWKNIPEGTESLAIVMYHYPNPEDRSHVSSYLLLWGIDPSIEGISHGAADDGNWYMGANKDGNAVSYTSPCSPSPGSHEYTIAAYALDAYPAGLPEESTIEVNFSTFMEAIEAGRILGKAELTFEAVNEGTAGEPDGNSQHPPSGDRSPGAAKGPGVREEQGGQQKYSVAQAVSDNAQLHTIAFNALAFFTGNPSADTFYPPGKVSDFFGFQYFRDVDVGGMGHNTTFVPRVANNVLAVLNDSQIEKLISMAHEQTELLSDYGYGRYPLMVAFRKNLESDFPAGTDRLDENAVIEYSGDLYQIDGAMSRRRAQVLGEIIQSFTAEQKARFDEMAAGSSATWGFPDDQVDKSTMPHSTHVLVMTYASEMFTWYAGDIESDTYFCPERHGTYYGGFYMKDAPVMDDPEFFIDINATGGSGAALLEILTTAQARSITALVDRQRSDLEALVETRREISGILRQFIDGQSVEKDKVMALMAEYGELDGRINYMYASTFAEVYRQLTPEQLEEIAGLRLSQEFEPADAYLFAEPVEYPDNIEYEFLFKGGSNAS